MKKLAILRHAKSSWSEPGMRDQERSLNKRGHKQLVLLSNWMTENNFAPDHVICSPATRTRQTLEGIKNSVKNAKVEIVDSLYNGLLEYYLEAVWVQESAQSLLIIGHNPTCDDLVRYLAKPGGQAYEKLMKEHYGTATLAVFETSIANWSDLGKASCSLNHLIKPIDIENDNLL